MKYEHSKINLDNIKVVIFDFDDTLAIHKDKDSGMKFSFHLKAKQFFVNKYYGSDIEVISSSSQELKVDGVKIISKLNNCKLDEILFIDDRQDVIELLKASGVKAILVNDIVL